jgi:hypothetical protein
MRRKSNFERTPNGGTINPNNVADFLLFAAGQSQAITNALVRALVAPGTWIPTIPEISDHDLASAIRVSSRMSSRYSLNSSQGGLWRHMEKLLSTVLRLQNRRPLLAKDIRRVRETILAVADYYRLNESEKNELSKWESEYDIFGKVGRDLLNSGISKDVRIARLRELRLDLRGKGKSKPRRGGVSANMTNASWQL